MRTLLSLLGFALSFALSLFAFVGCAPNHSGTSGVETAASEAPASAASVQAFQSTVYAFGKAQNCVKCHGGAVSPLWMSSDVALAYSFARPLVDMTNPTASVFATYAGNGHCNDPVCSNVANDAAIQDMLSQWAQLEVNQASPGVQVTPGATLANPPFVTATMPLPATIPLLTSNGNPAVLRFDLAQLTPPVAALSGAILEVSLRSYDAAFSEYKIYNPRIVGNSATVHISGIHVYIRAASGTGLGLEDVNQGDQWADLTALAAVIPLPAPLPSGPITTATPLTGIALGVQHQSAADVLTIGFANIQ